jgi:hypothetical protein
MTSHHHHQAPGREHRKPSDGKSLLLGLHKDWRTWVVIGLMLAAIGMYVFTLDDSVQPDSAAREGVPAAAATANPPQ